MDEILKAILESAFPGSNGGQHLSEVIIVTFFPLAPSCHQEDLHDHFLLMSFFHMLNELESMLVTAPRDV